MGVEPILRAYETRPSAGPPAKSQPPDSNREIGLMRADGAPARLGEEIPNDLTSKVAREGVEPSSPG